MIPSWIIENNKEEQEEVEQPVLHAPQSEPPLPKKQSPSEVYEDPRGSFEIDYALPKKQAPRGTQDEKRGSVDIDFTL